jgi:predicted transcriptional regulator
MRGAGTVTGRINLDHEQAVLKALTTTPQGTAAIVQQTGLYRSIVTNTLHRLAIQGRIVREKVQVRSSRFGYHFRWSVRG